MSKMPFLTVAASTATYGAALMAITRKRSSIDALRIANRTISSIHSASTTIAAVYLLTLSPWPVPQSRQGFDIHTSGALGSSKIDRLDDSQNPIISGRSAAGDALTAWETGYLVYDTAAMLLEAYLQKTEENPVKMVIRKKPVFFAHHLALISALGYLQKYISEGREKGVWVIVAFLTMNASNPLLHLRWWTKKSTSGVPIGIEVALAAVFAISRFWLVWWVLQSYGAHHGLGPWEALRRQRIECKTGTAVICGVNVLWWASLLSAVARKMKLKVDSAYFINGV